MLACYNLNASTSTPSGGWNAQDGAVYVQKNTWIIILPQLQFCNEEMGNFVGT